VFQALQRDRADCLAIIDLENDYVPRHEGTQPEFDRLPDPRLAVQDLKDRRINNSYGACYFPWVQVRDNISNAVLWMPPSVAALGTMAYSETRPGSELWFAPAGFNRGGLTQGAAGIPVTNVRYRLTSKERDLLYEANINPIASFPSEGIVVFGNKTLQVTPSALDRINVRRLMIFLKKEVSRIAATILFDQNVKTTWKRFTSQVEPFLSSVQSRFGLTEFKVVLDETTTTADLIDRNILYAKVFLKPARAIEFIAIDFNITRTGASFTD
jgi:phage tail sheath protein FI